MIRERFHRGDSNFFSAKRVLTTAFLVNRSLLVREREKKKTLKKKVKIAKMQMHPQQNLWYRPCEIFAYRRILSILIVLFVTYSQLITVNGQQKGDEVCETLPSEIHLIKGMSYAIRA